MLLHMYMIKWNVNRRYNGNTRQCLSSRVALSPGNVSLPLLRGIHSCCMCQDSRTQHVWAWVSITVALDKSILCPAVKTCSASAEASTFPFLRAHQCSAMRWSSDLPVCPMYAREHSLQGTLYTTPFLCHSGMGSFGWTNSCLRVWRGWKVTLMARELSTLQIDWDSPWM